MFVTHIRAMVPISEKLQRRMWEKSVVDLRQVHGSLTRLPSHPDQCAMSSGLHRDRLNGESTRTRKPNTKGVSRTWVGHEMIDELIHPLLLQIPPVDRPSEVVRLGPVCVHVPFTLNAKERAELKDSALRTAWLE